MGLGQHSQEYLLQERVARSQLFHNICKIVLGAFLLLATFDLMRSDSVTVWMAAVSYSAWGVLRLTHRRSAKLSANTCLAFFFCLFILQARYSQKKADDG